MSLGKNLTVSSTDESLEQEGLYSPMTEEGNFYIFPQGVNPMDFANSPMILVHCLSQVDRPISHEGWVKKTMHLMSYFGINEHENEDDENYVHPISHLLRWTGSQNLKSHKYTAYYRSMDHEGRFGRSSSWGSSYSGSRYGGYRSYGGYGGYGSGYYYGAAGTTAYSTHQQHEQQNRRRQQGIIALLMINEVLLK